MADTLHSLCRELLTTLQSWSPHGGGPLEGDEKAAEVDLIARATSFLQSRGCWLDDGQIEQSALPDTCVFDEGQPHNCIYAQQMLRGGKGKLDCPYWNTGSPTH